MFAEKLKEPFGIAFRDDYVYVGNTGEVVRFHYDKRSSKRTGEAEHILDLPGSGGHFTRTLAFSKDGQHLYISVGSSGNIEMEEDQRRAAILTCDPNGKTRGFCVRVAEQRWTCDRAGDRRRGSGERAR